MGSSNKRSEGFPNKDSATFVRFLSPPEMPRTKPGEPTTVSAPHSGAERRADLRSLEAFVKEDPPTSLAPNKSAPKRSWNRVPFAMYQRVSEHFLELPPC